MLLSPSSTLDAALRDTVMDDGASTALPSMLRDNPSPGDDGVFFPEEPQDLRDTGLTESEVEALVLKFLLNRGSSAGRIVADNLHLPHRIVTETLESLRAELLISLKGSGGVGDFVFELTDAGFQRAQRHMEKSTYVGAAPVPLDKYADSVSRQSLRQAKLDLPSLCRALADLLLQPTMVSQLGQALNAGRGLFLYGPPGNGKTSIAERLINSFGQHIWIPRTIGVDGELIRLYDPSNHQAVEEERVNLMKHDRRWIQIKRPTIVVGGELTLTQLDIRHNQYTGISEAPIHLKANCGTFVVDDFGRQRVTPTELLNRLIVPLEKCYDYLDLPSGRQIELPIEQLIAFATNLSPRDLVDEAFLRRIPYKIEVADPSEAEFRKLFDTLCPAVGIEYDQAAVDYLVRRYYQPQKRPFRFCHPRDLLRQIKNLCEFHDYPAVLTPQYFDVAVRNYFTAMPGHESTRKHAE